MFNLISDCFSQRLFQSLCRSFPDSPIWQWEGGSGEGYINTDIYGETKILSSVFWRFPYRCAFRVCFLKCKVVIPAFCLMDNHVHFVLYGTLKECCEFRDRFAHKYSLWYYNRYSCRRSEPIDFDIKLMEDEKYILNSIAYVLRNGIAAGIGLNTNI